MSLCNHNNSLLKLLYEPNGIYGKGKESKFEIKFYSNKLNDFNEYSLYKYKIGIKNKYIEDNNLTKKSIQVTYEILQEGKEKIFERKNNKLIINKVTNNKIMIPSNRTVLSFSFVSKVILSIPTSDIFMRFI